MGKVYFAHPVNTYGTPLEKAVEKLLRILFPNDEIENPNQPHHQAGYREYAERFKHEPLAKGTRGMRYFHELVLPFCQECVALPFLDGRMGVGVADEAKWYLERQMRSRLIAPTRDVSEMTEENFRQFVFDPISSDLFNIRDFTEKEKDEILKVDPKTGSSLVVSHEETRLRTFITYGQKMRPYEIAHLVELPVPEEFYGIPSAS